MIYEQLEADLLSEMNEQEDNLRIYRLNEPHTKHITSVERPATAKKYSMRYFNH
jgi:hypothetical protein